MPERVLWNLLRNRRVENAKFRRQHPVGPYVLDFYCEELDLCIEVDGAVHSEKAGRDRQRDAYLKRQGIDVVRIRAKDVNENIVGVVEMIGNDIREKREGA